MIENFVLSIQHATCTHSFRVWVTLLSTVLIHFGAYTLQQIHHLGLTSIKNPNMLLALLSWSSFGNGHLLWKYFEKSTAQLEGLNLWFYTWFKFKWFDFSYNLQITYVPPMDHHVYLTIKHQLDKFRIKEAEGTPLKSHKYFLIKGWHGNSGSTI